MSVLNSIDTHDLISSKENIQPLRRGRDTSKLCAALQAETNTDAHQELEKQRNEFEIKLRSNNSDDPLSDWCKYIHWIEQSFPKRGEEGKLNVIIHKCLKKFKDCKQYMNDIRFVQLCIKYAELEGNTLEMLSQIHRHGIGVNCAQLYIAWAEKFAVNNCFNKANAIYEKGLKCSAQPIQLLQDAYKEFQAFLVRKMLDEREIFQPTAFDSNPDERRQPYNILQSVVAGEKEIVPSNRTGSSIVGPAGKLKKMDQNDCNPKNNAVIKVFEDFGGNNSSNTPSSEPAAKLVKIPSRKTSTKENTVKPGPWNKKSNRHQVFKIDAPNSLPFQVHKDDDSEDSANKSRSVMSSVLKSHKVKPDYEDEGFANAPLFYPEPFDPTKMRMYCKEQVYAGGIEFQFEELRAMHYRRTLERLHKQQLNTMEQIITMAQPVTTPQPETQPFAVKLDSCSKPKTLKLKFSSLESNEKTKSKSLENFEKGKPKTGETLNKKEINEADIRRTAISETVPDEPVPCIDSSMTIHTKEALSEMQQLWFSKPSSPVALITKRPAGKSILKPSKPVFSLYVDESCLENFKGADQDKPLDLTFKLENPSSQDDGANEEAGGAQAKSYDEIEKNNDVLGVKRKTKLPNKIIYPLDKENFFNKDLCSSKIRTELKCDDEDKENGVPDDYCGPVGKSNRKVSGILTPANNIEIAELSDEEIEIYEDEVIERKEKEEQEDEDEPPLQDFSSIIRCNTTAITETWNFTKGFRFPRGESTPNMQKTFYKEADLEESFIPDPNIREFKTVAVEKNGLEAHKKEIKVEVSNTNVKKINDDVEACNKNLSVIAETSREYRSSSSGSSGATSTLAFRPSSTHSKYFPFTPSDVKNSKISLTTTQTMLHKGKIQNYTNYEASSESSQTALITPGIGNKEMDFNNTINMMKKLNAIDSTSMNDNSKELDKSKNLIKEMNRLEIGEKETSIKDKTFVNIDPFSEEVIERLLEQVEFPGSAHTAGFYLLDDTDFPPPKINSNITLGAFNFKVKKLLGEGSYARIFCLSNVTSGNSVVAKYQKPAFPWEFYIAREIQSRLKNSDLTAMFMNIDSAYFFKNCSLLLTSPVEYGDLLALIQKMKVGKMMCQMLAMHFTCQILRILEVLHSCKIIHGDIKPDNFLLRNYKDKLQLQLIDFGRSIDMSLFPEDTTFRKVVTTEGFTTVEMKTGKPWTYQIDYYGAAVCGHCLLFGDYMKVVERDGVWNISKIIPRYWAKNEWKNFFISLINVESCSKLPDLSKLRKSFEDILAESSEIEFGLYKLNNLLNNR